MLSANKKPAFSKEKKMNVLVFLIKEEHSVKTKCCSGKKMYTAQTLFGNCFPKSTMSFRSCENFPMTLNMQRI